MFGKKRDDVPETVSNATWARVQRGAAKAVPLIDGPWVDPKARATGNAWKTARANARQN
jgi:hypothetical protein